MGRTDVAGRSQASDWSRARSEARLAAVQALYQMDISGAGVETVILEFTTHRFGATSEGFALGEPDSDLFARILRGVVSNQKRIDRTIESLLSTNWTLSRLDATARAILRAGVYELVSEPSTPSAVAIDQYVEIANAFFEGDEPGFVNGVLDAAARSISQLSVGAPEPLTDG